MVHSRDGLWWAWPAALVACLLFEVFVLLQPLGATGFAVVDSLLVGLASAAAGWACRHRALREEGRRRSGWNWLSLSGATFAVSQLGYAVEYALGRESPAPGPTVSDLIVVPAIPFALVGLIRLAGSTSLTSVLINTLDVLLVAVSWLFVSWAWALGPALQDTKAGASEQATLVVFEVGALLVASMAVMLATRWPGDRATLLVALAGVWLSASQVALGVELFRDTYELGDPVLDLGHVGPFLLLALAALRPRDGRAENSIRRRWVVALAVPSAAIVIVLGTTFALIAEHRDVDHPLLVMGALLVLLVLARQGVTLIEHSTITMQLERRVENRTAEVRRYESQVRALLRDSSDVIAMIGEDGRFSYASPASWQLLGLPANELLGRHLLDFVHPDDRATTQATLASLRPPGTATAAFRLLCRYDQWCEVEATCSAINDEQLGRGHVLNIRDISERAAEQEQLRQQAFVDPLTSLANRRVFDDRVRHALDRARRPHEHVSVLFIDLDRFKDVNDTVGHAAGDEVLREVANRLRTVLRPADTAARLGGDEFAILLEGTTAAQAEEVAERVVTALGPPYDLSVGRLHVTASVGVTSTPGDAEQPDLVRDADTAMYRAKAAGRARVEVFEPGMNTELQEQRELESRLRKALEEERLEVLYQPVVDLGSGRVTGLEALLRWHPRPGEEVLPDDFLPLAERRGLVHAFDAWVLREACRQVRAWQQLYPTDVGIHAHVNLAAADLHHAELVDEVEDVLDETGLPAADLVVEVSESSVRPGDTDVIRTLSGLRSLGVRVWLDDFGSDQASLATLQGVPLDGLKLAPSFVGGIESGLRQRRLVRALLEVAETLGLRTVAEAVETARQEKYLQRMGCAEAQGYLYSPPLSVEQATVLLTRSRLRTGPLRSAEGAPPAEGDDGS